MKERDPDEMLTAEEIIEEFKAAAVSYSWTSNKLKEIWMSGGLEGGWDESIKEHRYTRDSVNKYIRHVHEILKDQMTSLNPGQQN